MTVLDLTAAAQDYLKLIWMATERSAAPVTVGGLAKTLGISASTASEGVRKLTAAGLVRHAPYGQVELTGAGRDLAVAIVRRHRLLETFLVEILGYGWDEVHDEADVLEHAVSETLVARMDQLLGHPVRDPHGDPIPSREGSLDDGKDVLLSAAPAGAPLTLTRIADTDPALLRYCAGLGLVPGAELTVVEPRPFAAGTTLRFAGHDTGIEIGPEAALAIWVTAPVDPGQGQGFKTVR
ncbi:metal-dependent transcriptional regulator [Pseudarthrobacter siccitolerans]